MSASAASLDEVALLREEIAVLRAQIAWLKQKLFGGGQSETLDRAQLLLQLGALEKLAATAPRAVATITYERAAGTSAPRVLPAETFAHLPVQETIELIPAAVRAEPELSEKIGEERTFEVDVTPPKLFKREFVRPKYRHRLDRNRAPLIAAARARPVAGGYASAGLLAWIALSKYVDHLPLYRLEQMSHRWGATLTRQTMADWIALTAQWLEPIYQRMYRELLAGGYVQADETPVRCNDPDEKRGGTTQGWLWIISKPGGDVVFDWRLSRRHNELTSLLDGYRGILQSDGYAAYPGFARSHEGVAWVGCWAHARRKFFEAAAERPPTTHRILRLIAQLYRLERAWDEARRRRAARRAAAATFCSSAPLAAPPRARVATQGPAPIRPRPGVRLSARPLGAVDRASSAQPDPARHQPRRKRDPALRRRQEKLALHRPPRRRPALRHHLLAGRLLPAPRQRPARVSARCPHPPAHDDQPGRPHRTDACPLAIFVGLRRNGYHYGRARRRLRQIGYHYEPSIRSPVGRLR